MVSTSSSRPLTRSQSKANANRIAAGTEPHIVVNLAAQLENLGDKAGQTSTEYYQTLHKNRISSILQALRETRNDAWRYRSVEEIFRDSKA